MHLTNSLHIDAPMDTVWALTLDVEAWPSMTPTMTRVERLDAGPLRVGSRARVSQPRMRPAVWTVTEVDPHGPGRHFVWQTRVLGALMVGGHHIEADAQGCRNTLTLDVSGWSAPLLRLVAGSAMRRSIATENAGFRDAAQRQAAQGAR